MDFSADAPLPRSAQAIEKVVGRKNTIMLADKTPYRNPKRLVVFVPKTMNPRHWIARAIGMEAAESLSRHFGGEHLTIPRMSAIRKAQVNRAVLSLAREGLSHRLIAHRLKIHHRRIPYIIEQAKAQGLMPERS